MPKYTSCILYLVKEPDDGGVIGINVTLNIIYGAVRGG